jgi:uncharacterized protein Usg
MQLGDEMAVRRMLQGYALTTAEILYHLPDHPTLLQTYIWQDYDLKPHFPVLHRFLEFWQRTLEGRLHSVRVGAAELVRTSQWRNAAVSLTLH